MIGNDLCLPMTDLQTLVDGSIKVCVEEDGFRQCGFVSSYHLVEVKAEQLRHLIRGSAVDDVGADAIAPC